MIKGDRINALITSNVTRAPRGIHIIVQVEKDETFWAIHIDNTNDQWRLFALADEGVTWEKP